MNSAPPTSDCTACELPARREFVARVAAALASLTLFLALSEGQALEVSFVSPHESRGKSKSYDIPVADGVRIDKDSEVILVRQQKSVWAFALSCPHQNTALKWNAKDGRFQCPKHKSKYRPDGAFIEGRATRAMDRYAIALEGAGLVINLDKLYQQDTDPAGWNAASATIP